MSQNPHDQLFKSTFSDVEHARGLFKVSFPSEISKKMDWDFLKLVPGSYINENLREFFSDLLFETRIGENPCLLYILVEHKSKRDPWVMLQLLQYQLSIWNRYRAEYPEARSLPPVLPLLVSHTKNGWKVSKRFDDLFALDHELMDLLKKYLPSFECVVQDLTKREEREIRKWSQIGAVAQLSLLLLKTLRNSPDTIGQFQKWLDILQQIERLPDGRSRFSLIFNYVFQVKKISTHEEKRLLSIINQYVGKKAEEGLMTGAERLREEGRTEGKAKTVEKLLQLKYGELSSENQIKLKHASESDLDRITELVLTNISLQEILNF